VVNSGAAFSSDEKLSNVRLKSLQNCPIFYMILISMMHKIHYFMHQQINSSAQKLKFTNIEINEGFAKKQQFDEIL